jgi:hypothetical protein
MRYYSKEKTAVNLQATANVRFANLAFDLSFRERCEYHATCLPELPEGDLIFDVKNSDVPALLAICQATTGNSVIFRDPLTINR